MKLTLPITTVLAAAALATGASAQTVFSATLDGGQEVPPVATPATGTVTVSLTTSTGAVTVSGTYTGLLGTATSAHLHGPAAVGANGPIVVPVGPTGGSTGTFAGSTTLSAANVANLQSGLLYMNVHSTLHPGGEIRGQVVATPLITIYGSGINPPGSLVDIGGPPAVGGSFTLGVDNPIGSQAPGGFGLLLFSLAPSSLALPGLGMSGPTGELLIDLTLNFPPVLFGGPWTGPGAPVPLSAPVPGNLNLVGLTIYAQGVLSDGVAPTIALADAAEIYVGI